MFVNRFIRGSKRMAPQNINNNLLNGVIFSRFQEAFDTIDHAKLRLYGAALNLLTGFSPTYLAESSKPLLVEPI